MINLYYGKGLLTLNKKTWKEASKTLVCYALLKMEPCCIISSWESTSAKKTDCICLQVFSVIKIVYGRAGGGESVMALESNWTTLVTQSCSCLDLK